MPQLQIRHRLHVTVANLLLLGSVSLHAGVLSSAEPAPQPSTISAAELLPETCVMFAEISNPRSLTDLVLEHPLRKEIESLAPVQELLSSKQMSQFRAGLRLFEAGMGKRWPAVLSSLTAGGVYLAFDADTQGLAMLVKADSSGVIEQIRETVFPALRGGKAPGSPDDPIKTGEYRGITAYGIGEEIKLAQLGSWLLITNKSDLGKKVLDLHLAMQQFDLDPSAFDSLADAAVFRRGLQVRPDSNAEKPQLAWGFFDIATIRESGAAAELYSGKTDNPLAELLFGGIASNLSKTELATFSMQASAKGIDLVVRTPHEINWGTEQRAYFFGPDGRATAPPLLKVRDGLFAMSAYRNLSEMWLRGDDLLTDNAADGLAQADTQLTTLFSGNDFGLDILGALEPEIQFIAAMQDFEKVLPRPAIRLPAFALKFEMKSPEVTTSEFRRVFQSFVGFLNVVGAMNGQPQLDLFERKDEESWQVGASYVPERGEQEATDAAINFNFSPTLVFVGRHVVLSSSRSLANELSTNLSAAELDSETGASKLSNGEELGPRLLQPAGQANTIAAVSAQVVAQILKENKQQLIAQNMLEKGHDRQAAENEIGLLLSLIEILESGQLSLTSDDKSLELSLKIQIRDE